MPTLPLPVRRRIAADVQEDGECPGDASAEDLLDVVTSVDQFQDTVWNALPAAPLRLSLGNARYRTSSTREQVDKLVARVAVARANFTMRRQRVR